MPAQLMPNARVRYFDGNGDPLSGGKVETYIAGTNTPIATYLDNNGTPNPWPVVLDSEGYATIYLAEGIYKVILKDADDVVEWTEDNVRIPYDSAGTGSGTEASPFVTHEVIDGQSATELEGETFDINDYSSVKYNCEIIRGTTVIVNLDFAVQILAGTPRIVYGLGMTEEIDHGVTFSVDLDGDIAKLKAALDSGAGNGTIKLSRRLIPA